MQPTAAARQSPPPTSVVCKRVVRLQADGPNIRCLFSDDTSQVLSRFVGGFIRPADQVEFDPSATDAAQEFRVIQAPERSRSELYMVSIGYVTHPKADKRNDYFVRAEVAGPRLGIRRIHLPAKAVRDYFYFSNRRHPGSQDETLFDLLKTTPAASPADLRLALKVRMLELQTEAAHRERWIAAERAFNLLANPELRACYEALLRDPDTPAVFPYGGFGSLIAAGGLSADRETFFATRILSFSPERRQRRFRALLRKIEFFGAYAVYRDSRRKAEVFLDKVSLPLAWDPTWNQWRHLVGAKFGIDATFIRSGKYRLHEGEWQLVNWETALPSRLQITTPADIQEVVANARKAYGRFGQFFDVIQGIRARVEREPVERQELRRICSDLGIPSDFDIAQISWKPDYDAFFYNQLCKRTRKLFLFRDEYLFELEHTVVVEVPEQGHATYIFSRPADLQHWVREYARTPKDDIRRNRANAAERLAFVGRVTHGRDPRAWVRDLRKRIGDPVDYALATEGPSEG